MMRAVLRKRTRCMTIHCRELLDLANECCVDLLELRKVEDDLWENTQRYDNQGSSGSTEAKRETHLSSVTSPVVLLAWVTLEIDRLQLCLLLKVDQRMQIGDEVVARLRWERIERRRMSERYVGCTDETVKHAPRILQAHPVRRDPRSSLCGCCQRRARATSCSPTDLRS